MPIANRTRRLTTGACLAAILLPLALLATAAKAEIDCSAGFNCGRMVYTERAPNGSANTRILMQNLDGSQPTLVLEHYFGVNANPGQFSFDAASHRIYFSLSPASFGGPKIYAVNVDGTDLANLADNGCINEDFSISPDGSKFAFRRNCGPTDDDGKIWLMDVDGGNQHLLTSDPLVSNDVTANNHEGPSFSPDGAFVVFTSEASSNGSRQVYRSTLDGQNVVALTNVASDTRFNDEPAYLPSGDIVFLSNRDATQGLSYNDLYRMDGNGGSRLRLTNIVGRKQTLVAGPVGSHVLFVNRPDPENFLIPPVLYVAKTDGTGAVALYNEPSESGQFSRGPQFSPDGTRVVFHLCIHIGDDCQFVRRVMDVDGGNPVTYDDPALGIRTGSAFGRPDTDSDGVIDGADNCPLLANGPPVAFSSTRANGNHDIWVQDLHGGDAQRLTSHSARDAEPNFNAAGSRLVFESNRINNRAEVYSMNADGSQVMRLTNAAGGNITPSFSPDGSKVTFIGSRDGGVRNVYIMNSDGSEQVKLTTNQGYASRANNPVFNHDGTRIAFDSDRGQIGNANHDIFSINLDGSGEERLTTALGRDIGPSYSRDGSRIVFISFRDDAAANGEIYVMNADGSNARRVTNSTLREGQPVFSPDGTQIAYRVFDGSISTLYVIGADGSGQRLLTGSESIEESPTFAPQLDSDGDGIGDACDETVGLPTPVGTDVVVTSPDGSVSFSEVTAEGVTTFLPITPDPEAMPEGYSLCETCSAFDITTTATIVPPITVCLVVPDSVSTETFQQLRLLHGEAGQWVDRTTLRIDEPGVPRQVCGEVDSLSPFALAAQAGVQDRLFSDGFDEQG